MSRISLRGGPRPHPAPLRRTALRGLAAMAVATSWVAGPMAGTSYAQGMADLEVDKRAPATVVAGEAMTFQIIVASNGPDPAGGVVARDNVPAGVTIDAVTGSGFAQCQAGVPGDPLRPTTCNFGTVEAGGTREMRIDVTVLPQTTGSLNNDVLVFSDPTDPNAAADPDNRNNIDTTRTDVRVVADLVLTKADSPDPVEAGEPLDYTLRLVNGGPSTARQVAIDDTLSDHVVFTSAEFESGSGACVHVVGTPNHVRCSVDDLDPREFAVVVLHTLVRSDTPPGIDRIVNEADATTSATDPAPGNNTDIIQRTTVAAPADLAITKTSDKDVYKPSSPIQYTITVVNNGPADAVKVVVVDFLPPPAQVSYVFDTGGCTFSSGANTLTCSFGTMKAGESKSINVHVRARGKAERVANTATVAADPSTPDPNPSNDGSTRTVCVSNSPRAC